MKLSKLYKVVLASSMMVASAAVFAAQPNAKVYSSSINIEGLYNADVQKNIDSQISKLTSKKYTLVLKDLTEEEIKAAVDNILRLPALPLTATRSDLLPHWLE